MSRMKVFHLWTIICKQRQCIEEQQYFRRLQLYYSGGYIYCFWYFTKSFFSYIWNGASLLVINTVYISWLTELNHINLGFLIQANWTTYGLGSQENKKSQENLHTAWNYSLVPSLPPKMNNLSILVTKLLKTRCRTIPAVPGLHDI